jgi:hypothetical protein
VDLKRKEEKEGGSRREREGGWEQEVHKRGKVRWMKAGNGEEADGSRYVCRKAKD